MKVFIEVAAVSSVTKVAHQRGVSTAAISKQLATLERHLGTHLFHRKNRQLTLTQIGEAYLLKCLDVLASVSAAQNIVLDAQKVPTGTLTVASGRYFAERFLVPKLTQFVNAYPDLTVNIIVGETAPNFEKDNVDVAFASSKPHYIDMVYRKFTQSSRMVCASPAYLADHPQPQVPEDLYQHRYITHSFRKKDNVLYFKGGKQLTLKPVLRLNDAGSMHLAALSGAGIICLNDYIVQQSILAGELIELLVDYKPSARPIYLMYRKPTFLEPKIRCFVDYIAHCYNDL